MTEITTTANPNFPIPTWDFQGISTGIDARKVVETGILPVINTGIANKRGRVGPNRGRYGDPADGMF